MRYLNEKRRQLTALAKMSELAATVQNRMMQIDRLLRNPKPPSAPKSSSKAYDNEVDFWKRKIAKLSSPVTVPSSAPRPHELRQRNALYGRSSNLDTPPDPSTVLVAPMDRLLIQRRDRRHVERSQFLNTAPHPSRRLESSERSCAKLCTLCWETPQMCKCVKELGRRPVVLCKVCFDVPCACGRKRTDDPRRKCYAIPHASYSSETSLRRRPFDRSPESRRSYRQRSGK